MAISRVQPMRPALSDVLDASDALETALEETNTVVAQLNRELGIEIDRSIREDARLNDAINNEIERATIAEQANASAIQVETQRATAAEQANASAIQVETQRATAAEQELANDITAIPAIEYGAQNNIEVLADDSATVSISFNDEKQSTPYVLISLEVEESDNVDADCYAIITQITVTGFTARLQNKDALNTIEATVYWIAIGE